MSPTQFLTDPRIPRWFITALCSSLILFSLWSGAKLYAGGELGLAAVKSDIKTLDTRVDSHDSRIQGLESMVTEHAKNQVQYERQVNKKLDQIVDHLLDLKKK